MPDYFDKAPERCKDCNAELIFVYDSLGIGYARCNCKCTCGKCGTKEKEGSLK